MRTEMWNLGVLWVLLASFCWTTCCFGHDKAPTITLTRNTVRWETVQVLEHHSKVTLDAHKLQARATPASKDDTTSTVTTDPSVTFTSVNGNTIAIRKDEPLSKLDPDLLDPDNKNATIADPNFSDDDDSFEEDVTPISTFRLGEEEEIEQIKPTTTAPPKILTATPGPIEESNQKPNILNRLHYLWLLFVPVVIIGSFLLFIALRRPRRNTVAGKLCDDGSDVHLEEGGGGGAGGRSYIGGLGGSGTTMVHFGPATRPGVTSPPPPYSPPSNAGPRTVQAPDIPAVRPVRASRGPGYLLRRLSGSTIATVSTFQEPPPQYGSDRTRVDTLVESAPTNENLTAERPSLEVEAMRMDPPALRMEPLGTTARQSPFRMPSHVEEEDIAMEPLNLAPMPLRMPTHAPDALPRRANVPFPIMAMPVPMDFVGRR